MPDPDPRAAARRAGWEATCRTKVGYVSERDGWAQIRRLRTRGLATFSKLRPYRCPACGLWHLGNRRRRKDRVA